MLSLALRDALAMRNLRYFLISLLIFGLSVVPIYLGFHFLLAWGLGYLTPLGETGWAWVSLVASFIAHTVFIGLMWVLLSPLTLLIMSLFNWSIYNNVYRAHYAQLPEKPEIASIASFSLVLAVFLKYMLWMLLASPLLLIPLVGQLVFFVLGFMLFRKMLLIDVLGFRLDKSAIRSASGLMENGRYVGATFLLYLVSLVPFVNFFVAYLAVVYISHRMMQDERETLPAAS